ncbi:PepSY domain-containing protein [Herbaspirillum lusitanum]|uniref:PepSY domain-containing protein n=1 Tax=Herbaspirillum lusitanum TaxID=213312 RepID=A0ABW9A522_9BURK
MSARRLVYLIHRWSGVFACMLMALWFLSGMVMLFIGYPKLTPWERLHALPSLASLSTQACCISPQQALVRSRNPEQVSELVLSSVRGRMVYRLREGDGRYRVVDAQDGNVAALTDAAAAILSARSFMADAGRAGAHYLGLIDEDRWTHSGALNAHRPLHMVQMDDAAHTLLYVSSATGEVVLDAPRAQRMWNFVGAWLHWLYMFRDRPSDPVWSWIVIVLSAVAVLSSIAGTFAGIWRWRFSGNYKSGSRSPYRENFMRWHHITGLLFAAITLTWIFSGLMSMNPLGIFNPAGARPDLRAYRGATPGQQSLPLNPAQALALLQQNGFDARELEWKVLGGRPYLLARNGADATRLIVAQQGGYAVREQWTPEDLLPAAARLMPPGIGLSSEELLQRYDKYYYGRQPEAMMGASERRLPALRLKFDDGGNTWVHLDLHSGEVELSADRAQRTGRWLFSFLHSWDLPLFLQTGALREVVLILLSTGGMLLSLTGIVIGYRRVRRWMGLAC